MMIKYTLEFECGNCGEKLNHKGTVMAYPYQTIPVLPPVGWDESKDLKCLLCAQCKKNESTS
jgi:hypothetical protein